MSHDFPDGPDYNPLPIEDDPWDVDTTSYPREVPLLPCYCHGDDFVPYCPRHTPLPGERPQDATDGPESDEEA